MFLANKLNKGSAPAATTDPQFNYVTMLLHGDGTNGAQNNTFLDSSTNNFTITRYGNTTQGSFSPYGSNWSNYFADGTQGLFLPTSSNLDLSGDFTVEGWFFKNGTTDKVVLGSDYPTRNIQIAFDQANVAGSAGIYNGSSWQSVTCSSSPNSQWFHLAFVRSGTTVTVYLNGTSQGTFTSSTNYRFTNGAVAALRGYNLGGWVGYISNFRIVNGTAVYTANFTPSTTPLTAITNTSLLTCQSNRFIDNSTNNFTITPNNAPSVQRFNPFGTATAYSTSVIGGSGYFDGTGDYLTAASNAAFQFGTGDFCIEYWYYPTSFPTFTTTISVGYTAGGGYVIQAATDGKPYFYTSPTTLITATTAYSLNAWNHFVVCRSGTTLSMFINGIRVGTTTDSTNYNIVADLTVGIGNIYPIFGYMGDVRLVKGSSVYTPSSTTLTVPTAPLTAISNTSLLLGMTNGAIFDNAMMNNLETVGNAQISTSVVKYGTGSLAFDGTGDWLTAPDTPNLQLSTGNFTIEGWVYLNVAGSARGFVSKGTSTTGWSLGTNSSNQVVFSYASSSITSTGTLSASTWYFITIVREGTSTNQTKIYISGTNDGTGTVATDFNQTNIMYIGADRVGSSALNGYIDDLRITKGYARYTANFTPPTAAFLDIGPT